MSHVYNNCPAFENDRFLLRFSQLDDAADLVSVYSDKKALPFFNSDNCHGDNFYYPNEDRMRQAIEFWLSSYSSKWFVRWTIIDKEKPKAIGTVEVFHRTWTYWICLKKTQNEGIQHMDWKKCIYFHANIMYNISMKGVSI